MCFVNKHSQLHFIDKEERNMTKSQYVMSEDL